MSNRRKPFVKLSPASKLKVRLNKARRLALIQEHRKAIEGIKHRRAEMGDAWCDATLEYRRRCLKELGVKP
jgi:hypothetical protein